MARSYEVDATRTEVRFTIGASGFGKTVGVMRVRSGRLDLDPGQPEQATITLALDPASIDTGYAAKDEYIKGTHFLDATQFPRLFFRTTKVFPDKNERAMVLGELTMHGVTRPVTVETELVQPPSGDGPVGFVGKVRLSRSEWGMDGLLSLIDDDVSIDFQLTAVPSP